MSSAEWKQRPPHKADAQGAHETCEPDEAREDDHRPAGAES